MRLPSTGETAFILPSLGGTVYSLRLGSQCLEVLDCDPIDEIASNPKFRGRLLFPFNDRIPDARYHFQGQNFQLPVNCPDDGSAIHGLIYNRTMDVLREEQGPDFACLVLATAFGANEFAGYPFAVTFEVEYLLQASSLTLKFRISNDGESEAPVALGWHPYFKLGDESIDQHSLKISTKSYVEVDESLLPTGSTPSVVGSAFDFNQERLIGAQELDLALMHSGLAVAELGLGNQKLVLSQDPEFFPYFQLYIPESRKSIALEPVSGATDSFNRPDLGLRVLPSGADVRTWCKVSLQA